jgi:ankyrin repeat protein
MANPQEQLMAALTAQPAIKSLVEERAEFVSMVKMQALVRVTCLEVMQGAPSQVDAYRREVVELQELVRSYLGEVRELRARAAAPPSSPSATTASLTSPMHSVPGSPGPLTMLVASFEEEPQSAWYENKPLPRFAVRVHGADGEPYTGEDDLALSVSMLNGRGQPETQRANGTGELLGGETTAVVRGGVAEFTSLRIGEPSSKHYGGFTMIITATQAPDGVGVEELRFGPMTVQVGRMWSKRRKAESELGPDDPITQIPGVGARYVSRLQLHGVSTIGQFAAMAATEDGRDTLCRLCKGDNPRNSLNAAKLNSMIEAANKAAGFATLAAALGSGGSNKRARAAPSPSISAGAATGCIPLPEHEPAFSLEELMLLSGTDGVLDEAAFSDEASTPGLPPLEADNYRSFSGDADDAEHRMRGMRLDGAQMGGAVVFGMGGLDGLQPKQPQSATASGATIDILPPKQCQGGGNAVSGFAALDALAGTSVGNPEDTWRGGPGAQPLAPSPPALALALRAAWRGDEASLDVAPTGGDRFGCSVVHLAALGGHAHVLSSLLSRTAFKSLADAPATGMGGATPLHLAACLGPKGEAAAEVLLREGGASASSLLIGGVSAAHLAAWTGAATLLGCLLEDDPALANAPTDAGLTPLECAALGGHTGCLDAVLAAGGVGGSTLPPLHCAALGGADEDGLRLLLAARGPEQVGTPCAAGWLPLHAAAAGASIVGVRALLDAGADVCATTADGHSALDIACACGHADLVAELIENGGAAVPRADDPRECSPMLCAAVSGEAECVRVLAARGGACDMIHLALAAGKLHGEPIGREFGECA